MEKLTELSYNRYSVVTKLDTLESKRFSMIFLFLELFFAATNVLIENDRNY